MSYVSEAYEKQVESLQFCTACFENPRLRGWNVSLPEREMWKTDIHALHQAETFYWNRRTVELVTATMGQLDLNEFIVSRDLVYCDVAWHYFGDVSPFNIEVTIHDLGKRMFPVRGLLWYYFATYGKPYLGVSAWVQTNMDNVTGRPTGPLSPVVWTSTDEGDSIVNSVPEERLTYKGISDDRVKVEMELMRRFAVASSMFLRQELLSATPTPIERHARKRLGIKPGAKVPEVNIVQLRRTVRRDSNHDGSAASDLEAEATEWNFQWTVRGHIRRQWYPSLGQHLPVFIHPYIKGPEDKPLKPRTTAIYSVTR